MQMIFYPHGQTYLPGMRQFEMNTRWRNDILILLLLSTLPATVHAQSLIFSLQLRPESGYASTLEFGVDADALSNLDSNDLPAPPAAPDTQWDAFLSMTEAPASIPNRWLRDIRALDDLTRKRVEIWTTILQVPAGGLTVDLTLAQQGVSPIPFRLTLLSPLNPDLEIEPPWQTVLDLPGGVQCLYWVLEYNDQVPVAPTAWGGVKSLFR